MRHKHAEIIHQWAEGAIIQGLKFNKEFIDLDTPVFSEDTVYRVKPGTENSGLPPGVRAGGDQADLMNRHKSAMSGGTLQGGFSPMKSQAFPDCKLQFNPNQTERTQLTVREQVALNLFSKFLTGVKPQEMTSKEFMEFSLSHYLDLADVFLKASGGR
jgi:hypothetical protein